MKALIAAALAGAAIAWMLACWAPTIANGAPEIYRSTAIASAYSTADSPGVEGCTGRRLSDHTLTFASLIVPCGARVEFCIRRRCVVGRRTDSGPYIRGRSFDLTLGLVHALGFRSVREWGVRTVTWRRLP